MDISKNQKLDLLYLTNPNIMNKYNKTQEITSIEPEELKFYRKRILILTKDYLRNKEVNPMLDNVFNHYANYLINYFKFIDKRELIQQEYKNVKKKEGKVDKYFQLNIENKKMMVQTKEQNKTIKDFLPIVVKERPKKKIIIPKKQNFDIKNKKFRIKGIK